QDAKAGRRASRAGMIVKDAVRCRVGQSTRCRSYVRGWNAQFRTDIGAFLDNQLFEAGSDYGRPQYVTDSFRRARLTWDSEALKYYKAIDKLPTIERSKLPLVNPPRVSARCNTSVGKQSPLRPC